MTTVDRNNENKETDVDNNNNNSNSNFVELSSPDELTEFINKND